MEARKQTLLIPFGTSNDGGGSGSHLLLAYKRVPLDEVLRYPLVLGDAHA